ncbi:MAG: sterol desaturase family protein [Pseudomonadota bacterium]
MDPFGSVLTTFALVWAALYALNVALMFATGLTIEALNRRHPERKIASAPPTLPRAQEIRRSIGQLAVSSVCLAGGLTLQWHGLGLVDPLAHSWWAVPLMLGVSILCHDCWYYFVHRLMHTRAFYRFHKPHHLSVVPSPWSNDASGTVDTLLVHGYYLVAPLVLPIPAAALLVHRVIDGVTSMVGHAGHEHTAGPAGRWPSPTPSIIFHDLHHSTFRTNFGHYFSIWDRVCGTLHPRYDAKVEEWETRLATARRPGRMPAE